MNDILAVDRLTVPLPRGADRANAVEDVSLTLGAGEIHCLVGESGSGKSMMASAIMGLLPASVGRPRGAILLEDENLLEAGDARMRQVRGARIGMIFQEPMTALNPLHTIGDQIGEMFRTHAALGRREIRDKVAGLLREVQIPDPDKAAHSYPHQLSGGQRQRAMIAMALALEPQVLIADEPTTALDVITQAQVLKLIHNLQRTKGTAVLFITHDLGVVAEIADRVSVMWKGNIVETGTADEVLNRPKHPYVRSLIGAIPALVPPDRDVPAVPSEPILRVEGLSKVYRRPSLLARLRRTTKAVDDVTLTVPRGGCVGVIGESGSGKSTLARCIVRLLDPDAGQILLDGTDLASLSQSQMRRVAEQVQMVFQDPFASLNPRQRVGEIVAQGLIVHGTPRSAALERAGELLELVGLTADAAGRFPHEFSGGQRQRIGLARAIALKPKLLVADEPVSALDVSVQAQILGLLASLRERMNLSLLFITHDLRVAAQICDRVAIMKNGAIVEEGATKDIFSRPSHAYTQQLLASIPGRHWHPPAFAGDPAAASSPAHA